MRDAGRVETSNPTVSQDAEHRARASTGRRLAIATDVFDYEQAVRWIGCAELVRARAWEFLQLVDEHLEQIRAAADRRDAAALARGASTLRLALDGLSGSRSRTLAAEVERAAQTGAIGRAVRLCDRLERELEDLRLALHGVIDASKAN